MLLRYILYVSVDRVLFARAKSFVYIGGGKDRRHRPSSRPPCRPRRRRRASSVWRRGQPSDRPAGRDSREPGAQHPSHAALDRPAAIHQVTVVTVLMASRRRRRRRRRSFPFRSLLAARLAGSATGRSHLAACGRAMGIYIQVHGGARALHSHAGQAAASPRPGASRLREAQSPLASRHR